MDKTTMFLVLISIVYACTEQERKMEIEQFRESLIGFLEKQPGEVSISLDIPAGNIYIGINDSVIMHAASTMKVPVMIEAYRQIDAGKITLEDSVPVINRFSSLIDGSPYTLDISDDGGESLYDRIGRQESVRQLIRNMIQYSGNLATNILIEYLGIRNIQKTVASLDAPEMMILRGVEDIKAYEAGQSNTTSARALTKLFRAIIEGRAASPESSSEMINILLGQQYSDKIPAGLPEGVKVAHKTGSITGIDHDAGIVYPQGKPPYILTILTRGFKDRNNAIACIAEVSRRVYRWYAGES